MWGSTHRRPAPALHAVGTASPGYPARGHTVHGRRRPARALMVVAFTPPCLGQPGHPGVP